MILALILACDPAEDSADPICDGAETVTWESQAHAFMTTYCVSCHSVYNTEARYGAPEGVDFDTEADVVRQKARVIARVIEEESMPVGGGVYDADLYLLDVYLSCTLADR